MEEQLDVAQRVNASRSTSAKPTAASKPRRGRPPGIPATPETKERARRQMLAKWADPEYRDRMTAVLREAAPLGGAAFAAMPRDAAYSEYMRGIGRLSHKTLPEMTQEERWFYDKLKRGNNYSREEALQYVFAS